ncbi:MAG TPA: DUF599 domain-containing protein [Pelagibacterium sp.]|uniref:DUF599 domain-containing protein n=1 Tax=Pelagibacterium sp. TaxID=1967288 RepID=UPI002BE4370A|nr:DUF599 domain-containing protein [Pelagibacterium sp.]HWJ88410.1 DUF599 domain-containing protein [Pelagibacterium sp.]
MNGFAIFASVLPLAAVFFYGWAAKILDRRRPSLASLMNEQRFNWVTQATRRDTPLDAILSGNLMSSVSFFASTTALLILALFAVVGQMPQYAPALSLISFGPKHSELDLQIHTLVMLILFVYAFLAFTLSLRQFNHFCIMLGTFDHRISAPPEDIRIIARINAMAAQRFNAGIRAYYFAIPMVSWFVSGWLAIGVTVGTVIMLLHREYFSDARWMVARITPH